MTTDPIKKDARRRELRSQAALRAAATLIERAIHALNVAIEEMQR